MTRSGREPETELVRLRKVLGAQAERLTALRRAARTETGGRRQRRAHCSCHAEHIPVVEVAETESSRYTVETVTFMLAPRTEPPCRAAPAR